MVTVVRKCYPAQIVVVIKFKCKFEYLVTYIICDYPFDNVDCATGGYIDDNNIFFFVLFS